MERVKEEVEGVRRRGKGGGAAEEGKHGAVEVLNVPWFNAT